MNETPPATPFKEQRLRLGLTLERLSERCAQEGSPISASQLSKIERGESTPYPRTRAVLAKILGLDIHLQKVEVSP